MINSINKYLIGKRKYLLVNLNIAINGDKIIIGVFEEIPSVIKVDYR
tara:strand:+ start:947 stop:1087 length:141 start_codon:yes stop_codon:yes gene_type:complete